MAETMDNLDQVESNTETPTGKSIVEQAIAEMEDNSPQDAKVVKESVKDKPKEESEDEPKEPEEEEELSPKEKRHLQQLEGSKKEAERLRNLAIAQASKRAEKDASSLLELYEEDPKFAKEVAEKFNWEGTQRWTAKRFFETKGADVSSKTYTQEEVDRMIAQSKTQLEHENALQEAKDLFNSLTEAEKEEAIAEFEELAEGKTLTRAKARKFAEMVTLSVTRGKKVVEKVDKTEALKKFSSTWIQSTKKADKEDLVEVIMDGKLVLLPSNQLK